MRYWDAQPFYQAGAICRGVCIWRWLEWCCTSAWWQGRLPESSFYNWGENHSRFWALVFIWWSKMQVLLSLGICFPLQLCLAWVENCSWLSSSHVLALCSLTRTYNNTAKTLVCIVPDLLEQLHLDIKQAEGVGGCPEWLPSWEHLQ